MSNDISGFDPAIHDPATFLQEKTEPETPAAEATPSAAKEEAKPDETKPDETKPDETKSDEQAKSDEKAEEKPKDIRVPKSRLDQALAKNRALESRVKELEAAATAAKPEGAVDTRTAMSQAREKYEDALLEGDRTAIKAARAEMERAEEAYLEERTSATSRAANTDAQAQAIFEEAVSAIESEYPAFDQSHADYNEGAMKYALNLMEGLVRSGMTHVDAMAEAADLAALKFGINRVGAPEEPTPGRKGEALKKAVDAATRQPPAQTRAGQDHTAAGGAALTVEGIAKLDGKSFDKLMKENPSAVLKLLEG